MLMIDVIGLDQKYIDIIERIVNTLKEECKQTETLYSIPLGTKFMFSDNNNSVYMKLYEDIDAGEIYYVDLKSVRTISHEASKKQPVINL